MRREHFHRQIRREFCKCGGQRIGHTGTLDERDVGTANRIRIPCEREARVADEYLAEILRPDVLHELEGETRRDVAVPISGRLFDDEPPTHELDLLPGNAHLQELLGGHELRRHGS